MAVAAATKKKPSKAFIYNSVIGVLIMLLFRFLPISIPFITDIGMEIIGIFIGTLYLWSTVDPMWGSLMSIAMIGLSHYAPMNAVLAACFGNPTLVQMFFLMTVIGVLVVNKITLYIGRFFLTRKIASGRPWVFTFVILIGVFLMSAFISAFAPIFLFWPVLYDVFQDIGYKKTDKYPKVMLILVVVASLIGFPAPPYMANGLALLSNYRTITNNAVEINDASYLFVCLFTGLIMIVGCVLFAKFVLRPDVTLLKNLDIETFNKKPLPKLSLTQKIVCILFIVLIVLMLLPSIAPTAPGMAFLKENTTGIAIIITAVLGAIRVEGKDLLSIRRVMSEQFNWGTYFLIAAAILIGSVLTDKSTGVTEFLNFILLPLFGNMSPLLFTILLLLVATVLTNICNSLVVGMILQPVIATYCATTGTHAAPIVTLMIFVVLLSASVTPAASPFAAIMYGNNEWLKPQDICKYTLGFLAVELVVVFIIGLPLANMVM